MATRSDGAGEPVDYQRPQLRVEAGVHTDAILALDVDPQGRFAVTAGSDKTVRVWRAGTLEPVAVLRPPAWHGGEGVMSLVAISPNGRWVAASSVMAGRTWARGKGGPSDRRMVVYLFDRMTSEVVSTIVTPLPPTALEFVSDEVIAVARGVTADLLLADVATGDRLGLLRAQPLPASMFRLERREGGLTALAEDGEVLDWAFSDAASADGVRPRRLRTEPQTVGLAASPDGRQLALSLAGSASLVFVDTDGLTDRPPRRVIPSAPPASEVGEADLRRFRLTAVAWSRDGKTVALAGSDGLAGLDSRSGGGRVWLVPTDGRGGPRPVAVEGAPVRHLAALPDGRWLFVTLKPALGIIDAAADPASIDYGPLEQRQIGPPEQWAMLLSPDAHEVTFVGAATGDRVALSLDNPAPHPPTRPGERVRRADRTRRPLWFSELGSGRKDLLTTSIRLGDFELTRLKEPRGAFDPRTRVGAISADDSTVAVSGWSGITLLDPAERTATLDTRVIPVGSRVLDLGLSADGTLLVYMLGDGSVRWVRTSDLEEVLAVLPVIERNGYVAWLPDGTYSVSAGLEDLIGWHVNRDPVLQAADFFEVFEFRDQYYRPHLDVRLEARDPLDDAGGAPTTDRPRAALLPPIVRIQSPDTDAPRPPGLVAVDVLVRTLGRAEVSEWKVLVDGRPLSTERVQRTELVDGRATFHLDLPPRELELALLAASGGRFGPAARIRVPAPTATSRGLDGIEELGVEPVDRRLRILAVGVADYEDPEKGPPDLGLPPKDAADLADAFGREEGGLYSEVEVRLLKDAQATRRKVLEGLEWLRTATRPDDVAVLFLAGHGNDYESGYYFLPHDADVSRPAETMVSGAALSEALAQIPGRTILLLDTCKSGAALSLTPFVNELAEPSKGVVVLTAATAEQLAEESVEWGNGAFTLALLGGMGGAADLLGRGEVTLNGLWYYVSDEVARLTERRQTPALAIPNTIPDFTISTAFAP